ncbi:helix-turn-helix transcriptional regulator [Flavobacterium sp.]|uniref:helix-turn-helix domain-containing protein n=1 Tax=Flavobacterium sp. TaxID=239 RepID=UPI00286A6480|nr:helix-turn-helix transcriptional regulator [Flavobacterium sp.]
MRLSQLLRDKLGLSQENLAQYLKIPLSQLAMYETGRRDLSADAHAKLTEMLLFLEQKNGNAEKEIQNSQELKALDKIQIKELEFQEINEQQLLDKIQKKYNQNIQLYLLANHLQTSNQYKVNYFCDSPQQESKSMG